jgi:hypothetical protein
MHSRWVGLAVLVVLIAGSNGPAWAQQGEPPEMTGDAAPATTAKPEPDETPESGDPTQPQPGQSPFEYESSEQISEDLSVSFPVDIQDP